MKDLNDLVATKQFYVAVWRVIDARGEEPNADTVRKVSQIVGKAIKANCYAEVSKVLKQFPKWVDDDTSADAHTYLNETTKVDLQPDEH